VWHGISFCLVVNGSGIKTTSCDHILHLKTTLEEHYNYTVTMDWDGSFFCSINIDWNSAGTVDLKLTHLAHHPLMPSNVFKTSLALVYTTGVLSIPCF
jgi:hypothetical protein